MAAYGRLSYSKIFASLLYWAFLYRVPALWEEYFFLPTDPRLGHGLLWSAGGETLYMSYVSRSFRRQCVNLFFAHLSVPQEKQMLSKGVSFARIPE